MTSLKSIEKKQNIRLPDVYMKLYQSDFEDINKMHIQVSDESINIKKFLEVNEIKDVLDEFYDYFGYEIVPIAETEYADYICLDYRTDKKEPAVIYWNYELVLENPIEGIMFLYNNIYELVTELK